MSDYHGKLLHFPSLKDSDAIRKFITSLPQRSDFVVRDTALMEQIKQKKPVHFLPNDIIDIHHSDAGHLEYKLLMIGILRDGTKAAVVLDAIEPFFELRVPADTPAWEFDARVAEIITQEKFWCTRREIVQHYHFKYFNEHPDNYVRLYFRTIAARSKCLTYFSRNFVELRTETCADDRSCYYRKVAREYKFALCDWNEIRDYDLVRDDTFVREKCCPYTFKLKVADIKSAKSAGLDFTADPIKYRDYLRDKSLEMSWDLETNTDIQTGNAPLPENVFSFPHGKGRNKHGHISVKEEDTIFMAACAFCWYHEKDPFLVVNFTDMPTQSRQDCLIIQCRNQIDIILIKSFLIERMSPEFVVAFNDGMYDWPFILRRAEEYDRCCGKNLMNFMKEHMSVVPLNDQTSKYVIKGVHREKIKLEAGIYIDNEFFDVPGFHCIDVRTIFRQLYPTAEKSSLNFFLAANKLGSKEDMPYQTMFKIYRMMRILMRYFNTSNYEEIMMQLDALCVDRGNDYDLFGEMELNPFPLLDNTPFNLRNLNAAEIRELVAHGTDIVHYCNIDARRCHDLLRVRNIIMDRREMANLTFTSMFDALFRAGGMKVRNILMGYGYDPEWNLAFSTLGSGIKSDKKYPGAYVIPPKKGLYRDHVIVKRCRRANIAQTRGPMADDIFAQIARGDDAYGLLNDDFDTRYPPSEGNDQNSSIDRPCSDIDFNALYPSITMAYNISPEKAIFSAKLHRELSDGRLDRFGHPYRFIEVRFRYGLPTQADEDKELIEGWIVQHTPAESIDERGRKTIKYEGMGILPHVLIMLGNVRSSVKKLMEVYLGPKEFLEKLFETQKPAGLAQKSYSEQCDLLREALNGELSARIAAHDANKKAYYAGRVKSFKEIIELFEREFFRGTSRGARTCESQSLSGLYEEIVFYYGYYNCKQNTIKVLMNSCYGETGNTLSPLFIPLVSGGITTYGQRSVKFIKAIVEQKNCSVKYGDTDSVYLSPPESYFAQVDVQYIHGEITKLQYWSRMIEISMEFLDMLVVEIGELLYKDNGTRFLRVAYEKILWPYMFMGKKKYLGIAHMGIVNLSLCLPTCTLSEFMKSKLLLIKGMEIKKRGASDILKHICFEIIKEAFCITCTKTLQEIVEDKLREIGTRQFPPELFVKSARYRLPGKKDNGEQKRGNVTVLRFVERMREIEKKYPNTEIRAPEAGERFNYIVLRKYPWCFDMRGRKIDIKIGDKYEYFESLKNEEYQKIYRTENPDEPDMSIDIDYYISHEIIGQFARFLTYHPEYDKFYNISTSGGAEVDDELLDHAYKEADKKAHDFAKKKLREFYNTRYAKQYESRGKIYQGNFRQINKIYKKSLEQQYGNIAAVFNPINTIITRGDDNYTSMRNEFIKNAKTRGKNSADTGILQLVRDKNLSPFALACKYTAKGGICDQRKSQYEASARKILAEFDKLIPEFESITKKHMAIMQDIINKTRKESFAAPLAKSATELDEDFILSQFAAHYLISATHSAPQAADESALVSKAWDVYNDLAGIYQSEYENELIRKELEFLKSRQVGAQIIPPSLQEDKKTTEENFRSWLDKNRDVEK